MTGNHPEMPPNDRLPGPANPYANHAAGLVADMPLFQLARTALSWAALLRFLAELPMSLAAVLLVVPGLLVVHDAEADDLVVNVIKIREQPAYRLQRVYAGQLESTRSSQLGFEFGGVIQRVEVEEGDRVRQGDVLLQLAPAVMEAELNGVMAQLETARAGVIAQQAQIELSQASLKRFEDLVAKGHGSKQELDERRSRSRVDVANGKVSDARLRSAIAAVDVVRANLAKMNIIAPFDGIVQRRMIDEGSIVSPGQPVLLLVEDGRLEARIGVPEAMVYLLDADTTYSLRVRDRLVPATLAAILPVADAATATVTALFQVSGEGLYAGTLCELVLAAEVREAGFWLPLNALSESQRGLWSVLAVREESGTATVEPRLVEILHRGADSVFVRGTLADNDLVVAAGTSRIVPGQSVRVANIDAGYAEQMAQR